MESIYYFDEKPSRGVMGGKGFTLATLAKSFNVPNGFVITAQAFGDDGLKPKHIDDVELALKKLGPGPFAVRSSASEEDGMEHSFAGQLDSFLNIERSAVIETAYRVFQSASSATVSLYRQERGLNEDSSGTAVIVQNMVAADFAGVAFSADPATHDRNTIVVAATQGLADRLVSGEVSGAHYRMTKQGQIIDQTLPNDEPLLSTAHLNAIVKLCINVESEQGMPQDIEWAIHNDELFLLQARAITTLSAIDDIIIWDNSNIVESYSGVTSPLTFSFARHIYAKVYENFLLTMGVSAEKTKAFGPVLENMLGYINGHVYYNLLNWYRALSTLPGFSMNRHFMEQMMGVRESLPHDLLESIVPKNISLWQKLTDSFSFLRSMAALLLHIMTVGRRVPAFHANIEQVLAKHRNLSDYSVTDLSNHYRELENKLLTGWNTPLINDFACMIAFGLSKSTLEKFCGDELGAVIHNAELIGQGDIVSAEPIQRIKKMAGLIRGNDDLIDRCLNGDQTVLQLDAELARQFSSYLEKFGDRCTQELKLESVNLRSDPRPALQAIAAMATVAESDMTKDNSSSTQENSLASSLRAKPFKRWITKWLTHWAKNRVRDRENLRFERTRLFGHVREIFLNIGSHFQQQSLMGESRDIFLLTREEVLAAIEGGITTNNLYELVAIRKKEQSAYELAEPPPNRFQTRGAVSADIKNNGFTSVEGDSEAKENSSDTRKGLGCSQGFVKAPARVIRDPRRESLQAGEILVAQFTDPGWIAVFSHAVAIVVERGSLLSHSAIVAREMGIPAVVALKDATTWIKSGDLIEVNGASGLVSKVDHA